MKEFKLPPKETMFSAFLRRDPSYDGIFLTAVRTTGIFCRPSCSAKKPRLENVEFFPNAREALLAGYRACRRCRPLDPSGTAPGWTRDLLRRIESDTSRRIRDADLRSEGIEPSTARRWFRKQTGLTFHGYQRARRLGEAMSRLKHGENLTQVAYDHGYESLSGFRDAFRARFGVAPGNGNAVSVVTVSRILTPLGPMLAGASDRGVCLLEFIDRRMIETQLTRLQNRIQCSYVPGNHPHLDLLAGELREYFSGTRSRFTVPLETPGTEFQRAAWDALRTIPYGTTRSYEQQAAMIGKPTAVRAVARANGDNRIAVIIPCHRVLGADGKMCGYGGGIWRKKLLLDLEKDVVKSKKRGSRSHAG